MPHSAAILFAVLQSARGPPVSACLSPSPSLTAAPPHAPLSACSSDDRDRAVQAFLSNKVDAWAANADQEVGDYLHSMTAQCLTPDELDAVAHKRCLVRQVLDVGALPPPRFECPNKSLVWQISSAQLPALRAPDAPSSPGPPPPPPSSPGCPGPGTLPPDPQPVPPVDQWEQVTLMRAKEFPLPVWFDCSKSCTRVVHREGRFDYVAPEWPHGRGSASSSSRPRHMSCWWMNFANPELFHSCVISTVRQDEHQVWRRTGEGGRKGGRAMAEKYWNGMHRRRRGDTPSCARPK